MAILLFLRFYNKLNDEEFIEKNIFLLIIKILLSVLIKYFKVLFPFIFLYLLIVFNEFFISKKQVKNELLLLYGAESNFLEKSAFDKYIEIKNFIKIFTFFLVLFLFFSRTGLTFFRIYKMYKKTQIDSKK